MKDEILKYQQRIRELEDENSLLKQNLELYENFNLNQKIISNANYGIIVYDSELKYKIWNPFMEKLTGISAKEILGKHPSDFFPFLTENKVIDKLYESLQSGNSFHTEFPFKTNEKNGWANDFSSVIKDRKNKISGIISIVTDISERKQVENEFLKIKEKAEERAQRFLSIIENTQAGYFFIDNDGLFQNVNNAWLRLYKYDSFEEVLGKHFATVQQIDNVKDAEQFIEGIRTGNPDFMIGDFSRKCKDGSIGYHSFSARPVYEDNKLIGIEGFIIDITKQKSIENELKKEKEIVEKNEEFLRLINNASLDQIYSYDLENRFIMANKTLCENLNLSADEIIGKTYRELGFPEENCKVWDEWHRETYKKGISVQISETPMPDGSTQYFEVNLFVIKNNNGNTLGISGVNRNITERIIAERELIKAKEKAEESEKNLLEAQRLAKIGSWQFNIVTNELYWSNELFKIFEQENNDRTQLYDNSIAKVHDEDRQTVKDVNKQAIELGKSYEFEYRIKTNSGEIKYIHEVGFANRNNEGKIINLFGTAQDITEQRLAEIQIKTAKEKAEESELKLKLIADNFVNGMLYQVAMIDETTRKFNYLSDVVNKLYNCTVEEAMQNSDLIYGKLHPDDVGELIEKEKEALKNMSIFEAESRVIKPDGSIRWAYYVSKPRIIDGIPCWDGIELDITERKQMELDLLYAKERAEESDRLKTEFINNLSHEIRTPMNGILGFSDLINNGNLSPEKRKHYTSIIQNSGNQLMRIIDDILEISKLGTKQVKLSEKVICLNDLLLEHFSIFDIKAKENKTPLYLKKGLSDIESSISIDNTKLNKILSNLLENALKFTNEGFIEFGYNLVKTNGQAHQYIEIYVKDTGIGIHPDKHETIFERFSQEEKNLSKNVGGLGLGLSIAKENAELLGGRILLQSEKGKGSTFFITIPYNPVNSNAGKTNSENDKTTIAEKQDEYTILIVEDEEVNYLYIETLLEDEIELNCRILHAKNGKEATEMCKEKKEISFVLMDMKMPIMNGFEATKLIKEFRPEIPIVAQTAYTTDEDKEKAFSAGCDDFISKPIRKKTLTEIINKFLIIKD